MCSACKDLSKIWDGEQQMLVSHFTNAKNGRPTFVIVQENEEKGPQSVSVEVRFCPWCGERLFGY